MTKIRPRFAAIPSIAFLGIEATCLMAFGCSKVFLVASAAFFVTLSLTVFEMLWAASNKSALFSVTSILIATGSFVLQGTLCIVGAALGDTSMRSISIASVTLLTISAALLVASSGTKMHSRQKIKSIEETTSAIDDIRMKLATLSVGLQGEMKLIVEETCEAARFASPCSSEATSEADLQIASEVERLSDAIQSNNIELARAAATSIERLVKLHTAISKQTSNERR